MPTFIPQMKASQIPLSKPKFPLSGSSLCPIHSYNGIYHSAQGQDHGSGKEYRDPPVPRRLVNPGARQNYLDTQTLLALCQNLGHVFSFVGYRYG